MLFNDSAMYFKDGKIEQLLNSLMSKICISENKLWAKIGN